MGVRFVHNAVLKYYPAVAADRTMADLLRSYVRHTRKAIDICDWRHL